MTNLEEMKRVIGDAVRDEEAARSACHEVEAYAKLWPFVFMVNGWDVWNGSKTALKLQVVRWLEDKGGSYDFYQFRNGWGLVGFRDLKAATHFKLRWSEESPVMSGLATPAPRQDWNPHPVKSTFESEYPTEAASRDGHARQAAHQEP